jgi:hypothetical protein
MPGWWGLIRATGRNHRTHRTDSNPFGARPPPRRAIAEQPPEARFGIVYVRALAAFTPLVSRDAAICPEGDTRSAAASRGASVLTTTLSDDAAGKA